MSDSEEVNSHRSPQREPVLRLTSDESITITSDPSLTPSEDSRQLGVLYRVPPPPAPPVLIPIQQDSTDDSIEMSFDWTDERTDEDCKSDETDPNDRVYFTSMHSGFFSSTSWPSEGDDEKERDDDNGQQGDDAAQGDDEKEIDDDNGEQGDDEAQRDDNKERDEDNGEQGDITLSRDLVCYVCNFWSGLSLAGGNHDVYGTISRLVGYSDLFQILVMIHESKNMMHQDD